MRCSTCDFYIDTKTDVCPSCKSFQPQQPAPVTSKSDSGSKTAINCAVIGCLSLIVAFIVVYFLISTALENTLRSI